MSASNDHFNVLLIKYLLNPVVSRGIKSQRKRYRPTEFKTLNAMYQLNKNVGRTWEIFACGKKTIGKTAQKIGRKAITRFICGEGLVFFKKTPRFKTTNIYELEKWVVDVFRFFEKKGMMQGIVQDFHKWRRNFLKRLENWLLPLLEKGHSLKDVLMNKLSTKRPLKGADPNPLKGAGIKPSGCEAFQGSKSNIEFLSPSIQTFIQTQQELYGRFKLREGDIHIFMNCYDLNHHQRAMTMGRVWLSNGLQPENPVRIYQKLLNKTKRKTCFMA